METKENQIKEKPRNGWHAFFLSLFFPALGQVYNGRITKAIIVFCLLLLLPVLFGISRGATFFYGLLAIKILQLILRIYIIIDSVVDAKRQKNYVPKSYNTWYYHLLIAFGITVVLWGYDINTRLGIQSFKIPTPSNNPTLQTGDYLIADMWVYTHEEPDYGDIVVYSGVDKQIYTFRVAGRPNDTIALLDNIVSINGKACKTKYIKDTLADGFPVSEWEEEFPNKHKHRMYKFKQHYDSTKATMPAIIVPANSYFLLGDNRDNALDSRYVGFVSKDCIQGRILYIYASTSFQRINIDIRDK